MSTCIEHLKSVSSVPIYNRWVDTSGLVIIRDIPNRQMGSLKGGLVSGILRYQRKYTIAKL